MYVAASIAFVYILAGTFFYSLAKAAGRADQRDARARAIAQHIARRATALRSGDNQDRMTVV